MGVEMGKIPVKKDPVRTATYSVPILFVLLVNIRLKEAWTANSPSARRNTFFNSSFAPRALSKSGHNRSVSGTRGRLGVVKAVSESELHTQIPRRKVTEILHMLSWRSYRLSLPKKSLMQSHRT